VAWGGLATYVLWLLGRLADSAAPAGIQSDDWGWVHGFALIVMIPFAVVALWAVIALVRALPDLASTRSLKGEIVRERKFRQWFEWGNEPKYWYYLAVDDGSEDRIKALRLRESVWSQHSQGDTVTAEITPNLGYVRTMKKS
jgi:hypothetical protein